MIPHSNKSDNVWTDPGPGIYTPEAVKRWDASARAATSEYAAAHAADDPWWLQLCLRAARSLFRVTVAAGVLGVAFIGYSILTTFASGRVAQILDAIQKAGQ
jgi:hypothetical protein